MEIKAEGLSIRPDDHNTLTIQSSGTKTPSRYPLHDPGTGDYRYQTTLATFDTLCKSATKVPLYL